MEPNSKFDNILDLEAAVRLTTAVQAFSGAGVSDYSKGRTEQSINADRARLSAAIDALTLEELKEFGVYRAWVLNG